jgi:hypothetical protein
MAKLKTVVLESILAAGLIFGAHSVSAQQKKAEYVAKVSYFNLNKKTIKREDSEKFIKEKLKGYDARVAEELTENGKKYPVFINIYDNKLNKDALMEKIGTISGYYTKVWTKKDYDAQNEIRKIYDEIIVSLYLERNIANVKGYFADKIIQLGTREELTSIDSAGMQSYMDELGKNDKINSFKLISDNSIAERVQDYNFYKNSKLYSPKEGDYFSTGIVTFKVNGKNRELEYSCIFRKINSKWKVIAVVP